MKNKFYKDFLNEKGGKFTLQYGYRSMALEVREAPQWLVLLFEKVWDEFKKGKFSYDGATFVKERYNDTVFEVASFIHDWFNHIGYVGKNVDKLFIIIMEELNYPSSKIRIRKFLMNFTFLNVLRHKFITKTYIGDINIDNYKN